MTQNPELEFEDDESSNQQETEESNFLIGSQNILNSLKEQQQQPKKKTNKRDIELLIEQAKRLFLYLECQTKRPQKYFEKKISLE